MKKMAGLILAASLALAPAFAFADRGRGSDGDRGRSGQSSVQAIQNDNSGPGSANSGPGNVMRDRDADDDDDDVVRLVSVNSGPGNVNRDDDDDDDVRPASVNSGSNNSGSRIVENISTGRGSDQERLRIRENGRVEIRGAMITSISGTTFQITAAGRTFTVNAGAARLQDRDDRLISFSNFAVGHEVRVEGVFSPITSTSVINATKVVDRSIEIDEDVCLDEDGFFDDDDDECVIVNPGDVTAPILSAIAAAPATTTAMISWTTNEPATSRVFFSTVNPLDINANTTQSVASGALVTSHALTLSGLTPNTTFLFVVRSVDASGNVATSGVFSFTTQSLATGNAPVISNVFTAPAENTATISWTTDKPASATVFIGTTNPLDLNAASTRAFTRPTLGNDHAIVIPGLLPNTTYRFILRSSDAAGNTATSGQFSFTTSSSPAGDVTAPVISGLVATVTAPATVMITWTTSEPASSRMFVSTVSPVVLTSPPTLSVVNPALVTSHSMTISGLGQGTLHHFVVRSADAAGNTATSGEVSLLVP